MKYTLWLIPLLLSANAVTVGQDQAPWIKSKQRLTILSANDGQVHLRSDPDAKAITEDSITVIHLGPDHPPLVKSLPVVQTVKLPNPRMAVMHPDGKRLLVPYDTGIRVFRWLFSPKHSFYMSNNRTAAC